MVGLTVPDRLRTRGWEVRVFAKNLLKGSIRKKIFFVKRWFVHSCYAHMVPCDSMADQSRFSSFYLCHYLFPHWKCSIDQCCWYYSSGIFAIRFSSPCSLCVMVFKTNQVLLSYNRFDYSHASNVLSLIRLNICGLLHIGCCCLNTALALLSPSVHVCLCAAICCHYVAEKLSTYSSLSASHKLCQCLCY